MQGTFTTRSEGAGCILLWRLIVFFSFANARMPGSSFSFFWHFRHANRRSPSQVDGYDLILLDTLLV